MLLYIQEHSVPSILHYQNAIMTFTMTIFIIIFLFIIIIIKKKQIHCDIISKTEHILPLFSNFHKPSWFNYLLYFKLWFFFILIITQ